MAPRISVMKYEVCFLKLLVNNNDKKINYTETMLRLMYNNKIVNYNLRASSDFLSATQPPLLFSGNIGSGLARVRKRIETRSI